MAEAPSPPAPSEPPPIHGAWDFQDVRAAVDAGLTAARMRSVLIKEGLWDEKDQSEYKKCIKKNKDRTLGPGYLQRIKGAGFAKDPPAAPWKSGKVPHYSHFFCQTCFDTPSRDECWFLKQDHCPCNSRPKETGTDGKKRKRGLKPFERRYVACRSSPSAWPLRLNPAVFGSFSPRPIRQANVGRAQTKSWNSL